jgi:hypothetical protein
VTLFEWTYIRQRDVILELVRRDLLPVSAASGRLPERRKGRAARIVGWVAGLMRHDHHRRMRGSIKQRGWGE